MDSYSTGASSDLHYSGRSPVLLCASSERAMARAHRTIEAFGLRVGASLPIEAAKQRIERQAAATAVWIELDSDCGGPMDELLSHVSRDVAAGRYAAVVSASAGLVDPLAARLNESPVELIVDADEAERTATLAIAGAAAGMPLRLSDVSGDSSNERLRQLSDEVSRIASTLARLSADPGAPAGVVQPRPIGELAPVSVETVRSVIRARRLRARYFPEELFADPAWDMMLDLLQAEIAQLRVPVSSLCVGAAVPATTALRWLKTMVRQGLFIRRADPHDGRRVFVELAPETSCALQSYFGELSQPTTI